MEYRRTERLWKASGLFDPWDDRVWAAAYGAAKAGEWRTLAGLLENHPEVGLVVMRAEDSGYTLLHQACWHGEAAMVEDLVRRGADPRAVTAKGETPAEVARRKGHDGCAAMLRLNAMPLLWGAEDLRALSPSPVDRIALVAGRYRWLGTVAARWTTELVIFPDGRFLLLRAAAYMGDDDLGGTILKGRVADASDYSVDRESFGPLEYELGDEAHSDVRRALVRMKLVPGFVDTADEESGLYGHPTAVAERVDATVWFTPNHLAWLGSFRARHIYLHNPLADFREPGERPLLPDHNRCGPDAPIVLQRFPTAFLR